MKETRTVTDASGASAASAAPTTRPDVEAAIERALGRLDLAARVRLLTGANFWALHPAPEAGLRAIVVSDGPAGVKGGSVELAETTTSLPSPTALAASWDEGLLAEVGELLAGEARRKDVDVLLGPTINIQRSPLGGRHFEAFSEDPLLTGRLAVAYVRGLQSHGVGGCPKHYVCNDSETERHTYSVELAERPLREVYLAPFERAVREAGAWTTMAAYNRVRGASMTENRLLADPLKERWGFDGVVMSDWYATYSTVASARAALDLVMPGPDGPWGEALLGAVGRGEVAESAIEEKVRRLLRLAARVGALEGVTPAAQRPVRAAQPDVSGLVRRASAAGSVLLRNDGLLPLQRSAIRRLAVIGPAAGREPAQGGGSSNLRPDYAVTDLDGLRSALEPDVEILADPPHALPGFQPLTSRQARLPLGPGETGAAGAEASPPGIRARILDPADGREIGREVRAGGEIGWHGNALVAGRPVVELATRLVPAVTGRHRIGVAVRGRVTIWLDGRQVLDDEIAPESGDDDALWSNPPFHAAEADLVAGRAVDLRVRWQKFYDQTLVMLRLALETPQPSQAEMLARAETLARGADAALVVVGTTKEDETEGEDRASLSLPRGQDELVERVAAVNPRTIVVVAAGSPVLMPWRDRVAAILLTWFPGQEAGNALADLVLGVVEPGGRLPTTWPARVEDVPVLDTRPRNGVLRYDEGIHVGYRAWLRAGLEPAFPFGHGLGYTDWQYLSARPAGEPDAPAVEVRLRNAGSRRGREVVQLYLSRPQSSVERPARWLAGFAAVEAEAGQEVPVVVPVDRWAVRHWDEAAADWTVEPGEFEVSIGRSVADVRLTTAVRIDR